MKPPMRRPESIIAVWQIASRACAFLRRAMAFSRRWAGSYFDSTRFRAPEVPHISIETTNICNAACVFCANPVMERRKQPLGMEDFKHVVDDFARIGGTRLDFNATIGEPTLDPHLLERVRYVQRYPQINPIGFVSTLQWLHRHRLEDFFSAGISWISVSCSLSGRESYAEFFGVDLYDQMLRNLIPLLETNAARGGPISIHVDVKPTNEPLEVVVRHPDFLRVAHLVNYDLEKQVRNRGFFVDDWQGAVELPDFLTLRPLYPRGYRPCRMLYKGLNVYSNGRVGACQCRDFEANSELILGRVENGLGPLWNGETLRNIRERWRRKNEIPEICRTCRYYMH